MNIIMYVIAVEAAVRLWFCAAPLQGFRWWLISQTPMFAVKSSPYTEGGHLFECKYCTSVWIGAVFAVFYFFFNGVVLDFIVTALVIHRVSNFVHLLILIPEEHVRQIRLERYIKSTNSRSPG
jgi:hypothetical protein